MLQPSLVPLPPVPGLPVVLGELIPLWIGSAADCAIHSDAAGVLDYHAALERRPDGWYISAGRGRTLLNGKPLTDDRRLRDRDEIEVAPQARYEFVSGEARTRRMESAADMIAPPRRRYGGIKAVRRDRPLAAMAVIAVAVVLFLGGIGVIWFGLFHAGRSATVLTEQQATRFDSLLVVAYDHIERGGTLLEIGLSNDAGLEFARAINTLQLSDLRDHPQVKPRIEALEATIAAIYRERQLTVPDAYASARAGPGEEDFRAASLSRRRFAQEFLQLSSAFRTQFRDSIFVVGRDHAEHVALYGRGGALDLRAKTMTQQQVRFVINQCRMRGIRVKDFSQDSVLRMQIRAAIQAGLLDRAGTGLHLHIDRFANRRDRWTVSLLPESAVGLANVRSAGT